MSIGPIDPNAIGHDEDCEGNDAAFRCPMCVKVFTVNDTQMPVGAKGERATENALVAQDKPSPTGAW